MDDSDCCQPSSHRGVNYYYRRLLTRREPLVRLLRSHDFPIDQDTAGVAAAFAVFELPSDVMAFPRQLSPAAVLRRILLDPVAFLRDELSQAAFGFGAPRRHIIENRRTQRKTPLPAERGGAIPEALLRELRRFSSRVRLPRAREHARRCHGRRCGHVLCTSGRRFDPSQRNDP
jgi:hypothetical protein